MRAFLLAACALFVPATALAQLAQPTGKLPDQARPTAYRLDMTLLPDQPRFNGHVEIDVDLKAPTTSLYMHGRDLHVTRAVVKQGRRETPVTFTQKTPFGLARVEFGRELPAGKVTLKFDYDAAYAGGPSGLYHLNIAGEWYSWSQFESIDARAAFPSFDEPGFKTPFSVSITTKPGLVAVSNAPETGKPKKAGKLVKHSFIPTKPLPTYLVALVVGPFATVGSAVPPTPERTAPLPLRVIGTKPNAGQLQYALDESGKIVSLLENYFGQPFPYPKLDQIGSPVMPGAMENAGADIYGDGILFLDEKASSETKQTFGMVVAHELAHQWFGDLVTPAWWDDIWLNESFANWMGYRIGNEWRPDLNIGVSAIAEGFDAMKLDALTVGRPIHQTITNDADIDTAFDQITYGKGGHVVGMIAGYMGEEKFRDGVRLHMKRYEYGNATTEQFFASLADAAHDPRVLASLRSFVDQQGVPVVSLHREGGRLTATQHRYAYFGSNLPATQWIIPLCIRRGETKSCTLVDKPSVTAEAAGTGTIVPNAGGWGYYRFDLDPADWDSLITAAPTLTDGEGLALNDSLWASFHAGKSSTARLVAHARSVAAKPVSKASLDVAARMRGLEQDGLISAAAAPAYHKLFVDLYGGELAKIGFDPAAGAYASDSADQRKLRTDLTNLVIKTGHEPVLRAKVSKALDDYLAGDAKALDTRFLSLAISVTVEERGVPFAKKLMQEAVAKPWMRQPVGMGIGYSGNADVARWFFSDFNDPSLSPRERLFIASAFLRAPATQGLASNYVIENFDTLSKAMGGGGIFSARLSGMFDVLCSNEQADRVSAKLRPQMRSPLNLDRAIDTIRNCARFRDAKAGEVSAAFGAK